MSAPAIRSLPARGLSALTAATAWVPASGLGGSAAGGTAWAVGYGKTGVARSPLIDRY